jgi:UrcA family protein
MSIPTLTAALAAAILASSAGLALAASAADQDPAGVTVKYADLDLTTQDGAKVMLQRIVQAAGQVCRPDADLAYLPGMGAWLNYCVSSRVEDTLSRLNAPAVTAAYKARELLAKRGPR